MIAEKQTMGKDAMGQCRLCLQERQLCRSHILPEFLYTHLYDPLHHRFYELDMAAKAMRHRYKGYRERLLCQPCEGILNTYEDYSSRVLTGQLPLHVYRDSEHCVTFGGVDYAKFKLFITSLIWRCSVSSLREFKRVDVGPHSEEMRVMLLNRDPGEPWKYGSLMGVPEDYEVAKQAMLTPEVMRLIGHRGYRFICAGYMWIVVVSTHARSFEFADFFLQRDGTFRLIKANALTKVWHRIAHRIQDKRH